MKTKRQTEALSVSVTMLDGNWGHVKTMDELQANLREAIEGCLSVPVDEPSLDVGDQVIELAL